MPATHSADIASLHFQNVSGDLPLTAEHRIDMATLRLASLHYMASSSIQHSYSAGKRATAVRLDK